ncbi:MAG: bifunctional UDP-N-acetylglucosamine diphosphorylase/glucosamine-1-phosphate N-acetyltransferase GlmU [Armatimonadetes bacterium]|nr:bifunctional UDP-N-acetylglucosamine diphosphorylase/glucosamine-1-phosphate N-acetyltransferase GlmU [Armatimonadota bacterium]MBS1711567.1 bifunctional UDP-N-acetylglucosamine diphosphorylase/glucosamine-1-phosphate N-acetyltransferase GlmU [Armatimonadota bacterium]MBX3109878.1 bifunctional UDP-N-acetylglucosamine diphosphorylase/glucosamine-1-phosphate N-acetyltransferase GlmU [Fimbriimonadaceae bacterium]
MTPCLAIVLAAGQGTRMKSDLPKVLHKACGRSLVKWVLASLGSAGVDDICVVVGHGAEAVRAELGDRVGYAVQTERLGTGHAVMSAADALASATGSVIVLAGDVPMIEPETIRKLVALQAGEGAEVAMATFSMANPTGYGRILRDTYGAVKGIVEEKDASPDEKAITEVNPAVYCFRAQTLREILPQISNQNAQGEYYLTDAIALIAAQGGRVLTIESDDPDEFLGINDRWQLAEAAGLIRKRILRNLIENGVSIPDTSTVTIDPDAEIGAGTTILSGTVIEGQTRIGSGCSIGPNTWIKDSIIGDSCRVFMSHLDGAAMEEGCRCGPFSNLRPGAVLKRETKIGNFVEIKNSEVGPETSISHLTYIGDATVGSETNIGAGTITCNYDGFDKHRTQIGDRCFIGSNSTLVAPVTVEDDSFVAAGSVVNRQVPSGAMAIGRARQENKEQWYTAWRERKTSEKK